MNFLIDYAWHARGSGYSHTVTNEGWRLMRKRLSHTTDILETLRTGEEKDPYGYEMALRAAMGLGAKHSEFESIVSESRSTFPTYYPVEALRATSLLPRWFGEKGDWEAFAKKASTFNGGLGDETYVRILMDLERFYADVFRDSEAEWPKAKQGLIILNEKYPESLEIQNYTAYFAVLGRDREMAREYFTLLGDAYLKDIWGKPERFVHFRTWAMTGRW